jgi:hypothetical protein
MRFLLTLAIWLSLGMTQSLAEDLILNCEWQETCISSTVRGEDMYCHNLPTRTVEEILYVDRGSRQLHYKQFSLSLETSHVEFNASSDSKHHSVSFKINRISGKITGSITIAGTTWETIYGVDGRCSKAIDQKF